jgi:pentatricopeptide repeat protein
MMMSSKRLLAKRPKILHKSFLHRRCLLNPHSTAQSRCSLSSQWLHRSHLASSSSTLFRYLSSLPASDTDDEKQQQVSTDTIVLPKLNLLSALESSPFQVNKTSEKIDDTAIEKVDASNQAADEDNTKSSLLELLKTDLFSLSWSGPDTERYESRHSQSYRREKRDTSYSSDEANNRRLWDSNSLERSTHTYYDAAPPSAERTKLDSILQESNELLESLSNNDGSSTLQLMDFDSVMTKLSRFNSEMENEANDINQDERAYSRRGYGENTSLKREAADKCAELLHALERNYDCILQHAKAKDVSNVTHTDSILPETKHSQLMPSASSYNHVLHTLAHSGKGQRVAMEASAILDRMLDRCRKYLTMKEDPSLPLPPPEPTIITFNSVIHAIAKSGADSAGFMAEEVFTKMEHWHRKCTLQSSSEDDQERVENRCYKGVAPDPRTLAVVLDAWANRDKVKAFSPERAESILKMAINRRRAYVKSVRGEDYDSPYLKSQVENDSFIDYDEDIIEEEYVDGVLETGGEVVRQIAEENLEVKEEAADDDIEECLQPKELCEPFLRPNTVAFNTCINAWATCGRGRTAAVRTQELLSQMEAISESGELDLPDADVDGNIGSDESSLVDHSLRPNVRSYSMVMKAWANVAKMERWSSEDAAEQCEAILNRMEIRGASDVSVRPNLVAYVTTITAWSRTKAAHAASRAEDILNRMIDLYYDGEDIELPSLEGDVEHAKHDAPFNAVITAYARSSDPNAAERAFAVLERLEVSPIAPTAFTYNAVMDVCAKHGDPERALQILEKMRDFSVTPDSTSYDTILNAYARLEKSGSAERAWELLRQWEEDCTSGENESFIPSQVSYSAVINGFAKASGKEYGGMDTVKKANEVYDRLIHQRENGAIYGAADPVANSCFLNCCANIYGTRAERKEALILAIKAFEEMKRNPSLHGEPGQFTFGTMMKACAKLSADAAEKNRLLESLFIQTCKRGLLSKSTLGQFLRHTPNEVSSKVILNMGGSKREIPPEWHRNVPEKHKPTPAERDSY